MENVFDIPEQLRECNSMTLIMSSLLIDVATSFFKTKVLFLLDGLTLTCFGGASAFFRSVTPRWQCVMRFISWCYGAGVRASRKKRTFVLKKRNSDVCQRV